MGLPPPLSPFPFSLPNPHGIKKKDFTLLFISLVGTTHVSSTAASKACKITMEAMAGRLEQTARPGCTSYSQRSENHQLPSNSDWVEKHLKKPPKHITAAAAEADHRVSSLVASAALRKSSLKKHKNDRPKKRTIYVTKN